jgi:hypothetical protein
MRRTSKTTGPLALARVLSFTLVAGFGLAACGGGDGVDIAGGQEPDSVVVEIPIAYVKRPIPAADGPLVPVSGATNLLAIEPGAQLYVRDLASPSGEEKNITGGRWGDLADIKDLSVSFDGTLLLFAMRAPIFPEMDDNDIESWNIWEYEFATGALRRVIDDEDLAGSGHDRFPQYLPDGRIVFSSTRQVKTAEIQVDEGSGQFTLFEESRTEPAFVLHVMNGDGTDIHQISFNPSHDLSPTVMSNGQIVFTRWDQALGYDELNLYRIDPDGTGFELLYGANSHFTGTDDNYIEFLQPREAPDGQLISIIRPRAGTNRGGQMVKIDVQNFVENSQAVEVMAGAAGPAQRAASVNDVNTEPGPSIGGRYASAFPLWDGTDRVLVSWAQCLGLDANNQAQACELVGAQQGVQPDPSYGIWLYDPADNKQSVIVAPEMGIWVTDVVAAEPRPQPEIIYDSVGSLSPYPQLAEEGWGILSVRSVYDVDGVDEAVPSGIAVLADPLVTSSSGRPARFLRIVKPTSIPGPTDLYVPPAAFGISVNFGMREILGYAPIEPDGSVRARVPANVPLSIEVLDETGRRLSQLGHNKWLQVMPGTEMTCKGCHDKDSGLSHGRADAFPSAYLGATASASFQNATTALQPLLGETMAETRTRISCANDNCAALELTPDIVYEDFWSPDERPPEAPFAYSYEDLQTPVPISEACNTEWSSNCRIVINYADHIHPLWYLSRPNVDATGNDRQCAACHKTSFNDFFNVFVDAPAFLDLSDGDSPDNANLLNAYYELLNFDFQQIDNGQGVLVDALIESVGFDEFGQPIVDEFGEPIVDEFGEPITVMIPVYVSRSLRPGDANGSRRFVRQFEPEGSHEGWLTPHELRLIYEWVDNGAQYYNSPFEIVRN